MNILITCHRFFPDIGGIETITEVLANYFIDQGHHVRVITGTSSHEFDNMFPFSIYRCPSAYELLRLYNWSDVILQNNLEVRRLWPLLFLKKPIVIGIQTWIRSLDFKRHLLHQVKLQFLRFATSLIACSQSIKLDCLSSAIVIGNPYCDHNFYLRPDISKRKSIVFVGRLVSDKGVDMLIRAFACLTNQNWHLTIIGNGPEEEYLHHLVDQLEVTASVSFAGSLVGNELAEELSRHEIMVVPSRWQEPFGVVALEGMASGCAMLVSNGGGLPDAVGNAGLLFQRNNQSDLNEKLQTLVNDSNLRLSLRSKAQSHLLNFTAESVGSKYLSVLFHAVDLHS